MSEGKDQRRFSREHKLSVIERMAAGEAVRALSRELGVARKCLHQWRDGYRIGGVITLRSRGRMTKAEAAADAVRLGWCRKLHHPERRRMR